MGFDPWSPTPQNPITTPAQPPGGTYQPPSGNDLPSGYHPQTNTGPAPAPAPDPNDPRTWSPDTWVHNLANPAIANAHSLQQAIEAGILTPEQAKSYLVQKDAMLARQNAWNRMPYRSWGGGGGFSGAAPMTPDQVNAWSLQPLGGNWNNPTQQLNLADAAIGGIPQAYQPGLYAWLGTQGWSPAGSLGQFGYRNWQSAMPYTFNEQAFNSITDPSLRAWAMALFGKGAAPTSW